MATQAPKIWSSGFGRSNHAKGLRLAHCRVESAARLILVMVWWAVSSAILLEWLDSLNVVHALEAGGGTLCHHEPARCFSGPEGLWVVCARCSGMYSGWLLSLAFLPVIRRGKRPWPILRVVAILFVIAAVSAGLERLGAFATSNHLRAIMGMPLGWFAGTLVLIAIDQLKKSDSSTTPS